MASSSTQLVAVSAQLSANERWRRNGAIRALMAQCRKLSEAQILEFYDRAQKRVCESLWAQKKAWSYSAAAFNWEVENLAWRSINKQGAFHRSDHQSAPGLGSAAQVQISKVGPPSVRSGVSDKTLQNLKYSFASHPASPPSSSSLSLSLTHTHTHTHNMSSNLDKPLGDIIAEGRGKRTSTVAKRGHSEVESASKDTDETAAVAKRAKLEYLPLSEMGRTRHGRIYDKSDPFNTNIVGVGIHKTQAFVGDEANLDAVHEDFKRRTKLMNGGELGRVSVQYQSVGRKKWITESRGLAKYADCTGDDNVFALPSPAAPAQIETGAAETASGDVPMPDAQPPATTVAKDTAAEQRAKKQAKNKARRAKRKEEREWVAKGGHKTAPPAARGPAGGPQRTQRLPTPDKVPGEDEEPRGWWVLDELQDHQMSKKEQAIKKAQLHKELDEEMDGYFAGADDGASSSRWNA
ncbi:hypothetical protein JX265_009962 [Neoarthrinium moseri]|uniref:Uncharacterized protein n=1 Tax=Neoarthrinium moseri TaxID=1658444 RepID=A0A9P9WFM3_9PEZI|nr:hypothetical protein JX265_009962 [Neoarthrinium moseri]